jgi:leucyl-tRNA synthetase
MDFSKIEATAKALWEKEQIYAVTNDAKKPKFYILDMFPYPSGSGLHVGHPLGYVASDIYARYKRLNGFNVLHPMGFDSFGLPAEQYAIQRGVHPAVGIAENVETYRKQLDNLGLSFDWSRQVNTCDSAFYKWTQWIVKQLFIHFYNKNTNTVEPIENLVAAFAEGGSSAVNAAHNWTTVFSASEWKNFSPKQQDEILMGYRLAYRTRGLVNWCEGLGTVLANDEIINGVSERGGYPVTKREMFQWNLRITAYADRLLEGLNRIEWSDALKNIQKNWIGRSEGAMVTFTVASPNPSRGGGLMQATDNRSVSPPREGQGEAFQVFTTRPDTIFGVTFAVLAPEHSLIPTITTDEQRETVENYVAWVKSRSDVERMAERKVSGAFTGSYCEHPFSGAKVPIYISEYVLAGYGTGAIMAVPSDDERDAAFAKHFDLPIIEVVDKSDYLSASLDDKVGKIINSDFLNGLEVKDAIKKAIEKIEEKGIGNGKVNYRLRDANMSRQRYWGEPYPIIFDADGVAHAVNDADLPVILPDLDDFKPTGTGEAPLAKAVEWRKASHPAASPNPSRGGGLTQAVDNSALTPSVSPSREAQNWNVDNSSAQPSVSPPREGQGEALREIDTMPGFCGSSWYWLRYMDPHNADALASREAMDYWRQVDMYLGGSEHAVGHLLYARMWQKFLFDLGVAPNDEPFKKLINQGMIQGISKLISVKTAEKTIEIHVPVKFVDMQDRISEADFRKIQEAEKIFEELNDDQLDWQSTPRGDIGGLTQNGERFLNTRSEVDKMSKRYRNTINPDDMVAEYGADVFRLFEMFLGPIEQSKPFDTKGIKGTDGFIKKYTNLFYQNDQFTVTDEAATADELRALHTCIKKVRDDIEKMGMNTCVSAFMICVNAFKDLKCNKRSVLQELTVLMAPFAPFITEHIWQELGNEGSIHRDAVYPIFEEKHLKSDTVDYPVQFNGKKKCNIFLPADATKEEVEALALAHPEVLKYLAGAAPKKVIVVMGKMVNMVV